MEHIYQISKYLKENFGEKVVKLSLEGGFTCPNRDGSKSTGGCTFCSSEGSGELASDIKGQMELLSTKWPNVNKYIAYFQSHTNTYAPTEKLREMYYEALDNDKIVGIAIATRPDCISDETLDLLSEINEKTFLWIELGLQTIHEKTRKNLNLCYPVSEYDEIVDKLNKRNIKYVTHLILGFEEETKEDMVASLKHITSRNIFGLKLHMLNVVKGSQMEKTHGEYNSFESPEEYINTICDLIELVPPEVTIHRLTGDVPRPILITPPWSYKKRTILNGIAHELKRRGTYQGSRL